MINIIQGTEVTINHIAQALELDRISYGEIYQLQLNTCLDYFNANPEIYIMAIEKETDKVIGYINFSPITEDMYNLLSSGQVVDTILDARDILSYTKGSVLWGYFSSIVVHPDYRQHGVATEMLFCWSDLIIRLATENSIYFKKIVADAVSDVGAHLLSEMGFSFVRPSKHESKIMTLDLFEKNTIDSKFSEKLLTVYQKYNGG